MIGVIYGIVAAGFAANCVIHKDPWESWPTVILQMIVEAAFWPILAVLCWINRR